MSVNTKNIAFELACRHDLDQIKQHLEANRTVSIFQDQLKNNQEDYGILSFNRDFIIQKSDIRHFIDLQEVAPPKLRTSLDNEVLANKSFELIARTNTSGSGQFTGPEFKYLLENVANLNKDHSNNITDFYLIDLRKESHGFINDYPVMFRATRNNINGYIEEEQILSHEESVFNLLEENCDHAIVGIASVTKKFNGGVKDADFVLLSHPIIETEKELVERISNELTEQLEFKVHYKRFPVQDYNRPSDKQVDEFITFFRTTSPTSWKHMHCSAGKGRTTTFEVMNDLLTNASEYAARESLAEKIFHNIDSMSCTNKLVEGLPSPTLLNQILLAHYEVGGALLIPHSEMKESKQITANERYEFLKDFYEYAISEEGFLCSDHEVSWSEWLTIP